MSWVTKMLIGLATAALLMFVFAVGRLSGEVAKVFQAKEEWVNGVRWGMCVRNLFAETNAVVIGPAEIEGMWKFHRAHPDLEPDMRRFATDGKWRVETFKRHE